VQGIGKKEKKKRKKDKKKNITFPQFLVIMLKKHSFKFLKPTFKLESNFDSESIINYCYIFIWQVTTPRRGAFHQVIFTHSKQKKQKTKQNKQTN
jgi:hypothetical protein